MSLNREKWKWGMKRKVKTSHLEIDAQNLSKRVSYEEWKEHLSLKHSTWDIYQTVNHLERNVKTMKMGWQSNTSNNKQK